MLAPGDELDRYTVEATLGEGGMAVVYRVRHRALGSVHALKVLTVQVKGAADRLMAEGRVQAGIDHPNALTVTDVIDVDGHPGLIMEYVDGGTLDVWLATDPPRDERLRVLKQVCAAVGRAHANGWVHRDLKPANVLLKPGDDGAQAKVADFGIVKLAHTPTARGATRSGAMMGTPGYMAPEQMEDASSVDARADVFSLGCLLVEALTGAPTFAGESQLELLGNVADDRRRSLPADDPLYAVAERCLARDPAERFADANALLEALDADQVSPQPAAPEETTSIPAAAPHLALAGAGGAALLLTAVGVSLAVGLLALLVVGLRGCGGEPTGTSMPERLTPTVFGSPLSGCPPGDARIGYVRLPGNPTFALGATVTLPEALPVLADPRDEASVVCTAPAGLKIVARERVRKGWLPIFRDAVEP